MAFMIIMAVVSKMTVSDVLASLKDLSVEELDRVLAAAEGERQTKRDAARRALLEEVKAKAAALGLSLEGLLQGAQQDSPPAKGARGPARPKYRHPATGESWSGRGSAPGWLKRLENEGRSREEFAVSGGVGGS